MTIVKRFSLIKEQV